MKLNQFRNVLEIAERGSLRAAARSLQFAQPALTRSLQELEHEIGGPLFQTDRKNSLTALGNLMLDLDALEFAELRVLSALQSGQNPGAVSSSLKLRASEIHQAITRIGVEVIGQSALIEEPMRPLYALNHESLLPEAFLTLVPRHLNGRANTIFGGSSEIQREIIAKQVLGV